MKIKNKFKFKTSNTFRDKRGWLKNILDGNFLPALKFIQKRHYKSKPLPQKDKHFIYNKWRNFVF